MPSQSTISALEILEQSSRHHQWIDVTTENGHPFSTFVVFPEKKDNAEIVIVIHENRGLTDRMHWVGDERAKHGYLTLCPDFLPGAGPNGSATDSFASSDVARTAIYLQRSKKLVYHLETSVGDTVKYLRDLTEA